MSSKISGRAAPGQPPTEVPRAGPRSRSGINPTDKTPASAARTPGDGQPRFEEPRLSLKNAPGQLADRLGLSPFGVVVGALVVAAAGVGAWWAFATPTSVPEVVLPAATEISIPSATIAAPEPLVVHVDGAVKVPGVHELAPKSRVIDAIQAAGGFALQADRSRINLALLLSDQQRVWVPTVGEEMPEVALPSRGTSARGEGDNPGRVDVNHADASSLQTLPGVGPVVAAAIIEHRNSNGAFVTLDDLVDVAGIGPAKLEQLRPFAQT